MPGMSRWIGIYYGLLLASVLAVGILAGIQRSPTSLVPILATFAVSLGIITQLIYPSRIWPLPKRAERTWKEFLPVP
jgi:hypothetical protein